MATSSDPIQNSRATVIVEPARSRQTAASDTPFRRVLASSVNVLLAGAQTATSVLAGPIAAAAVREVRADAVGSLAGRSSQSPGAGPGAMDGVAGSEMTSAHEMQRESQAFNMQLLALQEEIQQENRRFSTLSNVLRARHDTAKASIANIRS